MYISYKFGFFCIIYIFIISKKKKNILKYLLNNHKSFNRVCSIIIYLNNKYITSVLRILCCIFLGRCFEIYTYIQYLELLLS